MFWWFYRIQLYSLNKKLLKINLKIHNIDNYSSQLCCILNPFLYKKILESFLGILGANLRVYLCGLNKFGFLTIALCRDFCVVKYYSGPWGLLVVGFTKSTAWARVWTELDRKCLKIVSVPWYVYMCDVFIFYIQKESCLVA